MDKISHLPIKKSSNSRVEYYEKWKIFSNYFSIIILYIYDNLYEHNF